MEEPRASYIADGNGMVRKVKKLFDQFLEMLTVRLPHGPNISILGIYPEEQAYGGTKNLNMGHYSE